MSKERLEGIKEDVGTNARKEYEFITEILFDDALWLIEQAGRFEAYVKETAKVHEQNKRYLEAIEKVLYETGDKVIQNILEKVLEESE